MRKRIAFDFDGVIANTTKKKKEWLKKRNIKLKNVDKTNFYRELNKVMPKKTLDKIYEEMGKNIYTEETLLKTDAIRGAIATINKLSNQYDIYIITARPEHLIVHVREWLNKKNINKNIIEIFSSSWIEKQDICNQYNIKFLVDDDIRHLQKKKIDNRILFGKNQNTDSLGILKAKSWKDIEKMLL